MRFMLKQQSTFVMIELTKKQFRNALKQLPDPNRVDVYTKIKIPTFVDFYDVSQHSQSIIYDYDIIRFKCIEKIVYNYYETPNTELIWVLDQDIMIKAEEWYEDDFVIREGSEYYV